MSESKHTPGPPKPGPDTIGLILDGLENNEWGREHETAKRLCLAAPDLLTACQGAACIIADHIAGVDRTAWPEVLRRLRAAIAKAEGKGE